MRFSGCAVHMRHDPGVVAEVLVVTLLTLPVKLFGQAPVEASMS